MAKGGMKRPGKKEEEAEEEEREASKGKKLANYDPREFVQMGPVVLEDARYYGRSAALAGRFQSFNFEDGQLFLKLKASGTKHEELLRVLSGRRDRLVTVHVCAEGCTGQLSDEVLVHAVTFEETSLDRLPWLTNLEGYRAEDEDRDEMARLREEQKRMELESKEGAKKDSKKEKKRKKKEEAEEGRVDKSPRLEGEELDVGQKPLDVIFKDTGMDPDLSRRKKVLRKARKLGKAGKKKRKKKEKGSSSSGTSSSSTSSAGSTDDYGDAGLFEDEKRLRLIWRRCPGSLAARSIQEIKKSLLTSMGTTWEMNRSTLPPLYTQYGRQSVLPGMTAALQQESLTVCQALDLLTQGKVAACMDVLNQRLKSLEALGRGAHWTLCRQYELVRLEEGGMTEDQEKLAAARRAKEEERLRSLMSRPPAGKGGEPSQGGKTRKGKDTKGANKGQSGDSGKGQRRARRTR